MSFALTSAWKELRPHAQQSRLWRTTSRFPVVVAGRGSGKTELSRRKLVLSLPLIKPWPDPIYGIGLPTYGQAKKVAWPQLEALIPKDWLIKHGANKSELSFKTVWGSTLYVVGMDKPYRIEGNQIDGFILDEMSDQKPEAYTRTILPMLSHRHGWCWRVGKPKRTGIGAPAFREAFELGLAPNKLGIESYNWKSDTILTPEQLDELAGQMGEQELKEELNAIWLDATGGIFYAYVDSEIDGNLSSNALYRPDQVIGVGSDFNVDPMAWVLYHLTEGVMRVFDEIWIQNTSTQQTLDELHRRYGAHENGWLFIGDASSRNRHTSTASTDYMQIVNDKRFKNSRVLYPKSNPSIADRFASTNAMLCNAKGIRRLYIHPRCKKLRADLVSRTYKEGTRVADDTDKMVGHITDALGYPIHKLCPIRISDDGKNKVGIED